MRRKNIPVIAKIPNKRGIAEIYSQGNLIYKKIPEFNQHLKKLFDSHKIMLPDKLFMKEIVIISGKGGTGKTSLTASFAYLGGKDVIVADCDVDAADMHLLLQPDQKIQKVFLVANWADIDQDKCIRCGKCSDVCRLDAIPIIDGYDT